MPTISSRCWRSPGSARSSCRWTCAGPPRRSGASRRISAPASCWCPTSETPISGVDTIAVDAGVATRRCRARRQVRFRAPPRSAAAAVAVVRHDRRAQGADGHAWPHAEPPVHLRLQPDLQRGRPLHHGDAALFRRRALHDDGVSVHGRDGGHFPGALCSRRTSRRAVNEQRITALFLVPTLLRRLLEMPKASLPLMPGVRLLISSGSSLYPEERRRIMRELCPNFFNFYSSSEGGGISLLRPEHPDEASLSVGQVVFGAEVQIIDENHRPVPARHGRNDPLSRRRGRRQLLSQPGGERGRVPRRLVLSGRRRHVSTPTAFSISPAAPRT